MNKEGNLLIKNANLVRENEVEKGDLVVKNGFIERVGMVQRDRLTAESQIIDAQGLYVAPGFIDLQVNGGAGHNFEDSSTEEIEKIIAFHVSHGTTGFLPTTVTAPIAKIRSAIEKVKRTDNPAILGMHTEGPFISLKRKGAQNPQYILEPSIEKFNELVKGHEDFIKIVTIAPEVDGAEALLTRIKKIGAIPSLGHSDATYEETLKALDQGVALFTHMFNATREFHHREPGAVGAALESDVMVELIADGLHVHQAAIRLLLNAKGIDDICLITDSISAAGLKDGEYSIGGLDVWVKGGEARLADGTLAGSTLTMEQAVKNFMEFTKISFAEAVRAASLNPARLLNIAGRKGSLEKSKDADIVIFDEDLNVHYTIIGGEIVYSKDEGNCYE